MVRWVIFSAEVIVRVVVAGLGEILKLSAMAVTGTSSIHGLTVTVVVVMQPVPPAVKVIVDVPGDMPLTSPELESIVATKAS